jgi:hypothetical protein
MKTLIRKELRENLKLALPAFVIFGFVLWRLYQNAATQPLLTVSVLRPIHMICSMVGLGLGWFQIYHERHRDLWAFLIHRPVTKTKIFFAKVITGLCLYIVAMGLPLVGWVAGSAMPGQFASPFEWEMVLPVGGIFLMGTVWYFAGLLVGLRQARWFASRGLVLLAALFLSLLADSEPCWLPGFAQEYLVLGVGGAILALAAWGAFQGNGSDDDQPVWGRRALTCTLALGVTFIGVLSQAVFESLALRGHGSVSAYYEIARDGNLRQVILRPSQPAAILDAAGAPLKDPESGLKMSLAKFDKLVAESFPVSVDFGDQSEVRNLLQPGTRFFAPLQTVDRVAWYWTRRGRLAGYDTATRQLVATIEPDSFPRASDRFLRPQLDSDIEPEEDTGSQNGDAQQVLATRTRVYGIHLTDRSTKVLFTTTEDEPIGGARSIPNRGIVIVTRHCVQMIGRDGNPVWKVPCKSAYPRPIWVKVSELAAQGQFAVWVGPYFAANRQNRIDHRNYSRIFLVSDAEGVRAPIELEPPTAVHESQVAQAWSWRRSALLMPPVPIFYKLLGWRAIRIGMVGISSGTAVLCALAGWWLGRRYRFTLGAQLGWGAFHLLGGLPGFLAFLSVQEWPARERCPDCREMRPVELAECEHCQTPFPPPGKDGTEIFEPLVAG